MNERIKELALDAGLLNYVDHETPRRYFIDAGDDQENVEKFAELIVKECANVIAPMGDWCGGHGEPSMPSTGDCAKRLKEHFGVE